LDFMRELFGLTAEAETPVRGKSFTRMHLSGQSWLKNTSDGAAPEPPVPSKYPIRSAEIG
jgi:hypothetical protein